MVIVLLLSYWLMVSSALRKSATVDEQSHLFRGAAYLFAGATHFQLGHPLLGSTLSALPLLTEPIVNLPVDSDAWAEGDWSVAGDQFLWQRNAEPLRFLFLGRMVVIWLTLGLGGLVFRWGCQLAGVAAGAGAATLVLLDPNMIAHGRLITGDAPVALFLVLTLYGYWRYGRALRRGRIWWPGLVLAGIGAGLAAATKFNAGVLVPILLLEGGFLAIRWRDWRPLLGLVPAFLLAWLVVAAVYRFDLWQGILPGGSFWEDLVWQGAYAQKGHGAFLFGQVTGERRWLYFPIAIAIKTPLPSLALVAMAAVTAIVRWRERPVRKNSFYLLIPAGLYMAASMAAALNIGYRYLLPVLPFLFLFATAILLGRWERRTHVLVRSAAVILIVSAGLRAVSVWPDYVPFFNATVGNDGWKILADSNVDWGQDLPALADWQAENGGHALYLSYFGTAHPSAYGVAFTPLPTWDPAPEQGNPALQPFLPRGPAPGVYAISVNNLHGFVLGEARDTFAWFRGNEPVAQLGGSLFVYEVPADAPAVELAMSGLVPADLDPALLETLASNDLRLRWFDHRTSFVWPAGGGWAARTDESTTLPELQPFWPANPQTRAEGQVLYRLQPDTAPAWLEPEPGGDGPLRFRGAQRLPDEGGNIVLLTAWEVVERTQRPLKLFVHALDGSGAIVSQWDGLDVAPPGWWPGDVFVQSHRFAVPEPAIRFRLTAGVYDGETLLRLTETSLEE